VKRTGRAFDGPRRTVRRESFDDSGRRFRISDYAPHGFCGVLLIAAFAFAGHYMGQNAVARSLPREASSLDIIAPSSMSLAKGSLIPSNMDLDLTSLPLATEEEVVSTAKADFIEAEPKASERTAPAPGGKQPLIKKLAMTPPIWKLESTFKMKKHEKQKAVAEKRLALAEENCLARAIYFEARSETELGQLAVAKVILNRVRDPNYPKTICGVVYQGSDRRNSCQFSFACDGMPDDIRYKGAWDRSKLIAERAIAGDQSIRIIGAATNYHADYVNPRWTRTMKRLIKIGHHVFYSEG